ncbi:MAG: beta-ketoacyl synthase N-terminal-like domain-containing protein, partial [Bryobacteraceae bacterium]
MRRVAVTGIGVISALGHTAAEFRESLFAGRTGIAPLQLVDPAKFRFQKGAEVHGYDV